MRAMLTALLLGLAVSACGGKKAEPTATPTAIEPPTATAGSEIIAIGKFREALKAAYVYVAVEPVCEPAGTRACEDAAQTLAAVVLGTVTLTYESETIIEADESLNELREMLAGMPEGIRDGCAPIMEIMQTYLDSLMIEAQKQGYEKSGPSKPLFGVNTHDAYDAQKQCNDALKDAGFEPVYD